MRIPLGLRAAAGSSSGGPWNIASAVYNGSPINSYYVGTKDSNCQDVFFKPDGTKMYILGNGNDNVYEYNLSTVWDISTASYLQSFSVAAQEDTPNGISFKDDGTKMYIVGSTNDTVYEYNLSTAWNISTASYLQSFSVAAQDTFPGGLFFKTDGTKMYIVGVVNRIVYEYNLSTAWNISTASYLQSFSVAAQDASTPGISFKDDGTKMYIVGAFNDAIYEYNLSTAWNISTASYLQSFSVISYETTPNGVFFKGDGTKMYIIGSSANAVYQYDLSTAWNLATASFTNPTTNYFFIGTRDTLPSDVFFKPDGTKMYVAGSTNDNVYEYNLSTAWDISTASYLQSFSIVAQENSITGVSFKTDGTKMYIVGGTTDTVYEYNLSTAWNISTASYLQSFSVAAQDANPTGIFLKPDGTKMYIVGFITDHVYEYNLSTAWNVTTASYLQRFSVTAQDNTPNGISFKDDGTKMYIVGAVNDAIYEYNLSTAWNVTTASYLQSFSVAAQEAGPQGISFKDDGTKMYMIGTVRDSVWSYDL